MVFLIARRYIQASLLLFLLYVRGVFSSRRIKIGLMLLGYPPIKTKGGVDWIVQKRKGVRLIGYVSALNKQVVIDLNSK